MVTSGLVPLGVHDAALTEGGAAAAEQPELEGLWGGAHACKFGGSSSAMSAGADCSGSGCVKVSCPDLGGSSGMAAPCIVAAAAAQDLQLPMLGGAGSFLTQPDMPAQRPVVLPATARPPPTAAPAPAPAQALAAAAAPLEPLMSALDGSSCSEHWAPDLCEAHLAPLPAPPAGLVCQAGTPLGAAGRGTYLVWSQDVVRCLPILPPPALAPGSAAGSRSASACLPAPPPLPPQPPPQRQHYCLWGWAMPARRSRRQRCSCRRPPPSFRAANRT